MLCVLVLRTVYCFTDVSVVYQSNEFNAYQPAKSLGHDNIQADYNSIYRITPFPLLLGQNCWAQQKCSPNSSKLFVLGRLYTICWQKILFHSQHIQQFKTVQHMQQFKNVRIGATFILLLATPFLFCWTQHFQPTNEKKSALHQLFWTVGSKTLLGPTLLANKRGIGLLNYRESQVYKHYPIFLH